MGDIEVIGMSLLQGIIVDSKYGFKFPQEVIAKTVARLTHQIWKLIPMRENNEDWKKQLDSVIVEIAGLNEIFLSNPLFLPLLANLEGIKDETIEFELYRTKVFGSISLLQELKKNE